MGYPNGMTLDNYSGSSIAVEGGLAIRLIGEKTIPAIALDMDTGAGLGVTRRQTGAAVSGLRARFEHSGTQ